MQTCFRFIPDWYKQKDETCEIALHYYYVFRTVLQQQPHLRRYLTRCKHCRIYFITHPCNAGRIDLGCPFGCAHEHKRINSIKRSTAYNRTKKGRDNKKLLNAGVRKGDNACKKQTPPSQSENNIESESTSDTAEIKISEENQRIDAINQESATFDQDKRKTEAATADEAAQKKISVENRQINPDKKILHYLHCVLSLIENHFISCEQVLSMLRRINRQPGLRKRKEIDYIIDWFCCEPP